MGSKLIIVIALCGYMLTYTIKSFQENRPPVIKIDAPEKSAKFFWNSLIPYSISVTDDEDGNSEYDEIPSNEVILTVRYLSDSSNVTNYLQEKEKDMAALSWMSRSNCFTCHKAKDKLIGPSFEEIADRYKDRADTPEYLANKIIRGSSGTWGNQVMPAQPELELEKVKEIARWIMKNSSNTDFVYFSGTTGAFKTKQRPKEKAANAVYVLNAHYSDRGINGVSGSSKRGTTSCVLQSE